MVSDFPAQIREAKEFSHHGLGMVGGVGHDRKTLDMGAEGLMPIAVCITLSLDHQVATAPTSPCIISDGGRQTPHNVGSRMGNSCEGPWQVSNPREPLLSGAQRVCLLRSSMFGSLSRLCLKSQWIVGFQGFTGHMTGRKTMQNFRQP